MENKSIPVSKRGLKFGAIFGIGIGAITGLLMKVDTSVYDLVMNNVFIAILVIGLIGGLIGASFTVYDYLKGINE